MKPIAGFARPSGVQNPQSVAVQAHRRRACTATDLHNENFWIAPIGIHLAALWGLMVGISKMQVSCVRRTS
jgi:hypothetical protein